MERRHRVMAIERHTESPYPVVGDQELSHCVAFALILPLDLDGDVPIGHRPVAGPVLGTLLL